MVLHFGLRRYSSSSFPGSKSSILDIVARLGRTNSSEQDSLKSSRRTASKVVFPELDLKDEYLETVTADYRKVTTSLSHCRRVKAEDRP